MTASPAPRSTGPSADGAADGGPADATAPRVLLPRPAGAGADLMERLRELGCAPDHHPFIELVPETDTDMREAVEDLASGAFSWLVITSCAVFDALDAFDGSDSAVARGVSWSVPEGTRVAVVGEGSAACARERGIEPDLIAHGSGKALVAQMPAPARDDARPVLFPASSAAAATVPEGLRSLGYAVRQEIAYRPRSTSIDPAVVQDLATGGYAAIVLTSSMIARLAAALPIHLSTQVVTIGAPTTAAAREAGLRVDVEAEAPTPDALARAVATALHPTEDHPA